MSKQAWIVGVAILIVAGVIVVVVNRRSLDPVRDLTTPTTKNQEEPEDPLAIVRQTFRKDRDIGGCKAIVAQLNVYLERDAQRKPFVLTTTERDLLTRQLQLTASDLTELARNDFSPLDAHYLDTCQLIYDGISAMALSYSDLSEAAQLERAQQALAWAGRQVWRNNTPSRPVPPAFVLRRGNGNDLERAGVFLAALQTVGADGCLLGKPGDSKTAAFWSIGVLIGKDIFVFDLRSGMPIPGPAGKGIATLAQIRNNPKLAEPVTGAKPEDMKQRLSSTQVALAPPLSALAPRMGFLESALQLKPPIRLGIDFTEQFARFTKTDEKVVGWNPAGDPASPVHALAYFLPVAEGGLDRSEAPQNAMAQFQASLVPASRIPSQIREGVLPGEPGKRLLEKFVNNFISLPLQPGKPRDLMLRGQLDEAIRILVDLQTNISRVQSKLSTDSSIDDNATTWAQKMTETYAAMLQAERKFGSASPTALEARQQVELLNKNSGAMQMVIDRAAGEVILADIVYSLALCKHEQAERLSRQQRTPDEKRAAWSNAEVWWNTFVGTYSATAWIPAGQIAHARNMLALAQTQVKK